MASQNDTLLSNARSVGDAVVADVVGEVDLHNSPDLRGRLMRLLDEKPTGRLVLNLAGVPYMDSSAVAVLVETLKKVGKTAGKNKGKLCLIGLQPRVRGILEIARLDTIFQIRDSEADALNDQPASP
jgi:anti-sigma B factor antagonist